MSLVTTEIDFEDERSPDIVVQVGRNLWGFYIRVGEKLAMFVQLYNAESWIPVEWKNENFSGLDNKDWQNYFKTTSKEDIYFWNSKDPFELLKFDTKKLAWIHLCNIKDLPHLKSLSNFVICKNKFYVFLQTQIRIVCLENYCETHVEHKIDIHICEWKSLLVVNDSVYLLLIDKEYTKTVYRYNEDDGILVDLGRVAASGVHNMDDYEFYDWVHGNRIYYARETISSKSVLVDYFDVQITQWTHVCDVVVSEPNIHKILGTDDEFNVIYMLENGIRHQIIYMKPKLKDLALAKLLDSHQDSAFSALIEQVPIPITKYFENMCEVKKDERNELAQMQHFFKQKRTTH